VLLDDDKYEASKSEKKNVYFVNGLLNFLKSSRSGMANLFWGSVLKLLTNFEEILLRADGKFEEPNKFA